MMILSSLCRFRGIRKCSGLSRFILNRNYSVVTSFHNLRFFRSERAFIVSINFNNYRYFSSEGEINSVVFEKVCSETLDALCDFFENLVEDYDSLKGSDVVYADGVLTVNLGPAGTYVINRQSPNRQIWLSSPRSGPKRYDYIKTTGQWLYKHDNVTLNQFKDMKEYYNQLQQVNNELMRNYSLRCSNHEQLLATLRNINNYIQHAARLRVGKYKNDIGGLCRVAISNNNVNSLIKIMKTGEA